MVKAESAFVSAEPIHSRLTIDCIGGLIPQLMQLEPKTLDELKNALETAHRSQQRIHGVNLRAFQQLLQHQPEDMTATVQAGMTLAELQSHLRTAGQWLPVDPPGPDSLCIRDLITFNLSGPRRFGYGTIRDYLLELHVVLADGRVVKSGGKVVKNVAGYDLTKLFVGSRNTLGVVVEATFKLKPIPSVERIVQQTVASLEAAESLIQKILESELVPVVLDLHNLAAPGLAAAGACQVVAGFAGEPEEVDVQLVQAAEIGLSAPGSLEYDEQFWNNRTESGIRTASVLPSDLIKTIRDLGPAPFVARAGNGLICYKGHTGLPGSPVPLQLMRRIKNTFDPNHVFPELPL